MNVYFICTNDVQWLIFLLVSSGSFGRICRGRISKERSNSSVRQNVLIKTLTGLLQLQLFYQSDIHSRAKAYFISCVYKGKFRFEIFLLPLNLSSIALILFNVSMFTDQASNGEQEAFIRDCYLTSGTNHENVACIIAAVLDFPPLLIYMDLDDENLKRFLQQSRTGNVRICLSNL